MLFDKEYEFRGNHAIYVRFLKDEIHLFETMREAYTTAAIIGFINSTKMDREKSDIKASILPSEMQAKRVPLTYIYRLMMLLEPIENGDIQAYQDRTFRDDADSEKHPEKLAENMKLFNSYVLGGVEILYDKFKDCKTRKDTVNTLNDFLIEFFEDNNL